MFRWPTRVSLHSFPFPCFTFSIFRSPMSPRFLWNTHNSFNTPNARHPWSRPNSVPFLLVVWYNGLAYSTSRYGVCRTLRRMPHVPRFSYGRGMVCDDGATNMSFFYYLFCDQAMAIQFMKENGLLRSKVLCKTCGQDMTWSADSNRAEGFRWRCQRRVAGNRCNQFVSIKRGLWFQ